MSSDMTVGEGLLQSWNKMCEKGYEATVDNEVSLTYQNQAVKIFKFKPYNIFFPIEKTRAYDTQWGMKDSIGFKEAWKDPVKFVTITFDKWSNDEIIARTAKVYFTVNRPVKGQREKDSDWLEGQIVIKEGSIWPFEHKRDLLLESHNQN